MRLLSLRQLIVLLLAGSTFSFTFGAPAVAGPLNPNGLSPTVLFPVSDANAAEFIPLIGTPAPRLTFNNLSLPAAKADGLDLKSLFTDVAPATGDASSA